MWVCPLTQPVISSTSLVFTFLFLLLLPVLHSSPHYWSSPKSQSIDFYTLTPLLEDTEWLMIISRLNSIFECSDKVFQNLSYILLFQPISKIKSLAWTDRSFLIYVLVPKSMLSLFVSSSFLNQWVTYDYNLEYNPTFQKQECYKLLVSWS
jgi:hypothetical protein